MKITPLEQYREIIVKTIFKWCMPVIAVVGGLIWKGIQWTLKSILDTKATDKYLYTKV